MKRTVEPRIPYDVRALRARAAPSAGSERARGVEELLAAIVRWEDQPEEAERHSILQAIADAEGSSMRAIQLLGMSRRGFYAAIHRLGLDAALPDTFRR